MGPNDFDSSGNGFGSAAQQDVAYETSGTNPFSSVYPEGTGKFPKLAPRAFPDDEDESPGFDEVPVMEQLPGAGLTPPAFGAGMPYGGPGRMHDPGPTYGPPSSYGYGTMREPGSAPPLRGPSLPKVHSVPAQPVPAAPPASAAPPVSMEPVSPQPPPSERLPSESLPSESLPSEPMALPSAGWLSAPPLSAPVPEPPVVAETSEALTADWLLHGRRAQPGPGWRRTVYRATGGLIKVGESAASVRRRDLVNRVRTPVAGGHHRVAVMSLKGGVGKTTTAVGLGATLASLRGDRVIAMDANPDRGTLSDKVRLETAATVRDLLNDRAMIRRYADVRQFTSQASSRLEILASDRDPGVSIAFNAGDYRDVSWVLEHHYSISITDCGTGLLHSAMSGILELADHIVLVSSPSVDGARSASATLDWLEAHQYTDLVRGAVVVLSTIRPRSRSTVDLDRLEAHFASRCRDVVRIPYDAHLEEGAEVELDLLSPATQDAYLTLAATVADGFAVPRRARTQAGSALS